MLRPLTRHQEDFPHQVRKSSVYECYVIKSGYEEKIKKQNHSTALLNTDRQDKLLNKTPTYKDTFLHNLSNHTKDI